ncbi:hypothetical protein L209DRAFT_414872 [Thermothelomyces heterothallicus CBS 203.75]
MKQVTATQTDEEPRGFDPKRRLFREADVLRYCPALVWCPSLRQDIECDSSKNIRQVFPMAACRMRQTPGWAMQFSHSLRKALSTKYSSSYKMILLLSDG